jgi:hypothetical protein
MPQAPSHPVNQRRIRRTAQDRAGYAAHGKGNNLT